MVLKSLPPTRSCIGHLYSQSPEDFNVTTSCRTFPTNISFNVAILQGIQVLYLVEKRRLLEKVLLTAMSRALDIRNHVTRLEFKFIAGKTLRLL